MRARTRSDREFGKRASRRDDDLEPAAKVAVGIIEIQKSAEAAGRCNQPLHLVELEGLQGLHRRRAGKEHRAPARQHIKDVPESAARAHAVVAEKSRALRKLFPVDVIVAREPRQLVVVREPDGFRFARGAGRQPRYGRCRCRCRDTRVPRRARPCPTSTSDPPRRLSHYLFPYDCGVSVRITSTRRPGGNVAPTETVAAPTCIRPNASAV